MMTPKLHSHRHHHIRLMYDLSAAKKITKHKNIQW